jgi:hypothetical protein
MAAVQTTAGKAPTTQPARWLTGLPGNFVLINLEGPDPNAMAMFVFDFFPSKIQSTDRANWEAQDTTIGVKPLFYGNREPRKLSVTELVLDATDTIGDSITPQINALRNLQVETRNGTPPALLAVWGDEQLRCVLEEVQIERQFFDKRGMPTRAQVSLQLVELQEEGAATQIG